MTSKLNTRGVIARKELVARLEDILGGGAYEDGKRAALLAAFKEALETGKAEVRRRFEDEGLKGGAAIRLNSHLVDQLIRTLYDFTRARVRTFTAPISLVATGGYGRGQLAPFSDIDLMFLVPPGRVAGVEAAVEYMLYMLWDLGLKVGHATRTVDQCLKLAVADLTIRTSLLEARHLWGDKALFEDFQHRFRDGVVADSGPFFVEAKLAERDQRHARMGDTRYVLEPNVKEGKGGLRDLQTLMWLARYLYQVDDVRELVARDVLSASDAARFAKAENMLWTVRCHLHYLTGRAEERLAFNLQTQIAARMNYRDRAGSLAVERLMKHFFLTAKNVGALTGVLCAVLEDQQKKKRFRLPSFSMLRRTIEGFAIDNGRLAVKEDGAFAKDPILMLRLFQEALRTDLEIHPKTLKLVSRNLGRIDGRLRKNADANRVFLEIMTADKDPEKTLTHMNEAGVLGRFVPDFGRVIAQMQYDMYHVYTVDEHTVRALGILHRIEAGELVQDHPVSSEIIKEVQSRNVLYVAVLLHDIAKGRKGDHSELGARIASRLCPRLGLTDWETETVSWLVLHHLSMSRAAFKRDLDDTKTISDFVNIVQSPERLRLLLVLTVADIRAVGPGVWNQWKAQLLRELYWRALEEMSGQAGSGRKAARVEKSKDVLRQRLADWPADLVEKHIAKGYPNYWLTAGSDLHERQARLIREAEENGKDVFVRSRTDEALGYTELMVYTVDHPGVFARIAGAIALSSAEIADAKVATLSDGMAIDTFSIQDSQGEAFTAPERLKRLRARVRSALRSEIRPARELEQRRATALPSRTRVFTVAPRVLIDNKASRTNTVIEINGRDRAGFLYDVTRCLTDIGLQIGSAHISTYGERVVDVFYVRDIFGLKLEGDEKIALVRKKLLAAIDPPAMPEDAPMEAVRKAG